TGSLLDSRGRSQGSLGRTIAGVARSRLSRVDVLPDGLHRTRVRPRRPQEPAVERASGGGALKQINEAWSHDAAEINWIPGRCDTARTTQASGLFRLVSRAQR